MKTENLTWAEAIKAYANGERIRDRRGCEFWVGVTGDCPRSQNNNGDGDFEFPCSSETPFSIVKPEPKKLTFDEALDRTELDDKMVEILCPHRTVHLRQSNTGFEFLVQAAFLDLAERRGWAITIAK